MNLEKKRILLFYPYGTTIHYGEHIEMELKKRGAIVKSYDERPSQTTISKIITRLSKKKIPHLFLSYIKKIIEENKNIEFDFILIIRGEAFTSLSINTLKDAYPNAYSILYLWDILETNNISEIIHLFDRALSFDPQDAASNKGLIFRPTFFLDSFKNVKKLSNKPFDVLFIGTLRPIRYIILNKIKRKLDSKGKPTFFYYFIPSKIIYFKDKILFKNYAPIKEVTFTPMPLVQMLIYLQNSKCVLDLKYGTQYGLSMRAFEALAAKRKYITNNKTIETYDFYNKNNILIIDEENFDIPDDFISTPFIDIPEACYNKYSITSWVNDVFSLEGSQLQNLSF